MKTLYIICFAFAVISCENISKKFEEVTESSGSNTDGTTETDFPIAGTWYVNDSGEDYNENALNFSEYTFETPVNVDGKLTGKLNTVLFEDGSPTRSGNYEITGENKLKVSFPNEMDYELTYVYYPEEQKLEINFAGQNRTLIRKQSIAETEITENSEEVAVKDSVQIRKEQVLEIAGVKWESKISSGRHIKLSQPTVENGVVKGTIDFQNDMSNFYTGTYEKLSENKYSTIFNKGYMVVNGQKRDERDYSYGYTFSLEPIDDGNAILVKWFQQGSGTLYKTERFYK